MAGENAPGHNAGLTVAEQMIGAHGEAAASIPARPTVSPAAPHPYLDQRGGYRDDPRQPLNASAHRVQEPKRPGQAAMLAT